MTHLQREWEDILEPHGLSAEHGDTALDRVCYFGNPHTYTDEDSEFSTFIDGLRAEPKAWWLEPSRPVVPIRIITPEELRALDPGGSALSYFVDQRTKYRFNAYSSELQAARFRGKRHTAEHNRKMSEALKEAWKRVTPEEKARRIAARVARGYQKCRPGCPCAKHKVHKGLGKGKKHNVSPEGLWRQDVARRAPRGRCSFRCRSPASLLPPFPPHYHSNDGRAAKPIRQGGGGGRNRP